MLTGSMVALVTPFTANGNVDYNLLAELVEFHVQHGTDAIVAVGTTGESTTLSHDEHVDVIRATLEVADGRIKVIAGNGSNSTAEAIQLTERIAPLGVDAFLSVTPYYSKPSRKGLIEHFTHICNVSDTPLLLYNVPGRTSRDVPPELVAELAEIPNVVGIKEATGNLDRVTELQRLCGHDFFLLSGDDPTACDFMLAGGHGVIGVTANLMPNSMKQLCDLACKREVEKAKTIDARLQPLHQALFVESNPIPVKWAMARLGWIQAVYRLPLTPPELASQNVIEEALYQAGLLESRSTNEVT